MIKSVRIIPNDTDSIDLELSNPWDSSLIIKGIDGLGPPNANINSTELGMVDGSIFNSAHFPARNIVFHLTFLEDPETFLIETTRRKTYRYWPSKREITMIFFMDHGIYGITGVVESNEPSIFEQEEGCSISVICHDPFFYKLGEGSEYDDETDNEMLGITPGFEFPFSNEVESINNITNHIEFGQTNYKTGKDGIVYFRDDIYNYGEYESGITVTMKINYTITTLLGLENLTTGAKMELDITKLSLITDKNDGLRAGDTIVIQTTPRSKYVYLYRDMNVYNLRSLMPKLVNWVTLAIGKNDINIYGKQLSNASISLKAHNLYGGI